MSQGNAPEGQKIVYHGWIVTESSKGLKDWLWPEYRENGHLVHGPTFRSPAEVVEWWDQKVGKPVMLLPTPLKAYRVYTYEPIKTA